MRLTCKLKFDLDSTSHQSGTKESHEKHEHAQLISLQRERSQEKENTRNEGHGRAWLLNIVIV